MTSYRINNGFLPIEHPSSGSGTPHLFSFPELVHCAVIDDLGSLGMFKRENWDPKNIETILDGLGRCDEGDYAFYYIAYVQHHHNGVFWRLHIRDCAQEAIYLARAIVNVKGLYNVAVKQLGEPGK